jgi:hypothetical protein
VCLPALFRAGSAHGVLPFRALLLSRSRTPSPAPTSLLALRDPQRPSRSDGGTRKNLRRRTRSVQPEPPEPRLEPPAPHHRSSATPYNSTKWPKGSTLVYRALLHARIRHSRASGLGRHGARGSLGLLTLQGIPPRRGAPAFTGAPLMGFPPRDANGPRRNPPGSLPQRGWLVSLETADPPGLLRLLTITNVRVGRGSGVASSGPGVRRRPLSNPL